MKRILLSALLSLTLAFPVPGALNFNATTAEVDFGSAASLDDLAASTYMFIYRPTTVDTTFRYLWRKFQGPGGTNINHHDSDIEFTRVYSTTNMVALKLSPLFTGKAKAKARNAASKICFIFSLLVRVTEN